MPLSWAYQAYHLTSGHYQILTGAKRREWMGLGVAGMIITSDYGSFPHSLLSTSKNMEHILRPMTRNL